MARRKPKSGAFSKVPGPSAAQEKSRLLNLPPEIRNRIYSYVSSGTIRGWYYKSPKAQRAFSKKIPPIIGVCKQTHAEATPVYYTETIFDFKYDNRFVQWARAIGHERCCMLKEVRLGNSRKLWAVYQEFGDSPESGIREFGSHETKFPSTQAGESSHFFYTSTPQETAEKAATNVPYLEPYYLRFNLVRCIN